MVGGYILVDCEGLDLLKGSTPQTISGIRKKVEDAMATGKPVVAANCVWGDGVSVTPVSVMLIELGDYIIATSATLQIWISKQDVITISNLVGE